MFQKIDIVGAFHDGLGFAAGRYSEVLRLSWLPIALIMLAGPGIANFAVAQGPGWGIQPEFLFWLIFAPLSVLLQASVMVALIRTAVNGYPPHHRSAHLAIGPREFLYVLSGLLGIGMVGLLLWGPYNYSLQFLDAFARQQETIEVYRFVEGSLHQGSKNLLYEDGHPIRNLELPITVVAFAGMGYVALRLLLLPSFVAAGTGKVFRRTLKASAGFNIIRLLLVLAVLWFLFWVTSWAAQLIASLGFFIAGLFAFIPQLLGGFGLDFAAEGWISELGTWTSLLIGYGISILFEAFTLGIVSGFFGAIVRQFREA
ncbi:hypothetical protein [Parvularcula lutaonensis]|uniref:Uncharacterized protein n=1 Tax=Parvularcula lutaonensis TaxID=491923 RepID=A0ABV7M765_9PROT|nr:hypothetical protein [Parvularcula lutaonensis]GGY41171.1 hypothetical protein GCM10007148_07190 [Parvularcula lutaonensis]